MAERGTALGSRENPAPLGATVKTRIERGDRYSAPEVYNLEISLVEVVRGKEARERIEGQNVAGRPRAGFEYVLCCVRVGYFSKARGFAHSGEKFEVSPEHFAAMAGDGGAEFERSRPLAAAQSGAHRHIPGCERIAGGLDRPRSDRGGGRPP